jgi:hypothetical protein
MYQKNSEKEIERGQKRENIETKSNLVWDCVGIEIRGKRQEQGKSKRSLIVEMTRPEMGRRVRERELKFQLLSFFFSVECQRERRRRKEEREEREMKKLFF